MKETEKIWILRGYETFAISGPASLKIEQLSKEVGISKSSFYHHFTNLEIFIEELLQYHLINAKIMAEKEKSATSINPELIFILIEHKTDLLFNRQLRINAAHPIYKSILDKANEIIGKDFIQLWLTDTHLDINNQQAEAIFELALENFFLQINQDNLNQTWLKSYFENLERLTRKFEKSMYGSD